jgi:transposase InsO family protein
MIEISGLARSTYYYYAKRRTEPDKYSEVKEQITNIYHENRGRYGYRRITQELHNRG